MSARAYKSALLVAGVGWTAVACLIITIADHGSGAVKLVAAIILTAVALTVVALDARDRGDAS